MNQLWTRSLLILVAALTVVAGIAVHSARRARAELALHGLADGKQHQLNDTTAAILARTKLERDTLAALVKAKDQLNGELIAGLRLHVAARDTVVRHDTLVTTLAPDSTRTASFRDSTFAGVLDGTVTAPPCCAPLSLRYALQRPAFDPSVGFVRVGDRVVAVVTWQGERVEVQGAYADVPAAPKRFGTFVEGGIAYPDGTTFVRTGGYARLKGLSGFVAGEQYLAKDQPLRLQVGVRKEF